MIWIIVTVSIIFAITGGLVDGWNYRRLTDKELTDAKRKKLNYLWHNIKPLRDISAVSLGALFVVHSQLTFWVIVSDFILAASINWILFDIFNYMGMGVSIPILHVSEWAKKGNNGTIWNLLASPYTKLGLLAGAIVFVILI